MSTFYFISGARGSGTTAIIPYLKIILGDSIPVYDFDDISVPDDSAKKWRQESTEKWIQKLLSDGKDAFLLGQIVLGEILACPSANKIDKFHFFFLDVSDFERMQRLKKHNHYTADQNTLHWSSWLRMHHQDPQWMQHVITENCWPNLDHAKWNGLANWYTKVTIIDTTHLLAEQVAYDIVHSTHNAINKALSNSVLQMGIVAPYQVQCSTPSEINWICHGLYKFNKATLNTNEVVETERNYVIKRNDSIVAGINAMIYLKILWIHSLWVSESYRNQDFGSKLLIAIEKEGKSMGATLSHLDTYDFQAKDFYLKQGYEIFGVLENCPQGHKRYYLKKIL